MAGNNWEMARQDYLLAKQLQGVSPRTLSDYEGGTGKFVEYLEDNNLPLTTMTVRQFIARLDVGPVTLGIRIKVLRTFLPLATRRRVSTNRYHDINPKPEGSTGVPLRAIRGRYSTADTGSKEEAERPRPGDGLTGHRY